MGQRTQILFGTSMLLALCPAMTALVLLRTGSSVDSWWACFQVSLYIIHAVLALGLCLAIRGWCLYFGAK